MQAILLPGSIYALVPGTKQEAKFEFTQETKDGIPLRFKGIIVYRITDPIAAARLFDFSGGDGIDQVTSLLTDICLGELRHAVSHMTMIECIEQRKTTLSEAANAALQTAVHAADGEEDGWGVTIEVAQIAQVFIVDPQLRQQLEAEVRNEIKLKSDQSNLRTLEETRLAEMESAGRIEERKLSGDRESLRREEVLQVAQLARERRMQAEDVATQRQALLLEQERFRAQMDTEHDRVETEAPVRLLRIARERDALREELEMRKLQNEVKLLDVDHELMLPRGQQQLRLEMLPLEQTPQVVEAASKVLSGANVSIYGENTQFLAQLGPIFEILSRAVQQATHSDRSPSREQQPL